MDLTIADIKEDIAVYQEQIEKAEAELEALFLENLSYDYKKREKLKRDLQAEISHIQKLIKYAHEGIAIRQNTCK